MKKPTIFAALLFVAAISIWAVSQNDQLSGAWQLKQGSNTSTVIFMDKYFAVSDYDSTGKKFHSTYGGTYTFSGGKLNLKIEFDTKNKEQVGQSLSISASVSGSAFKTDLSGSTSNWKRLDNGTGGLVGNWRITGRMQDGKINPMRPGPRKTIKILSGSRFQWAAINTDTKEFFGTGGGYYTFENGKYTEHISFFSRDSSRVGAALSFDAKVEGKDWNHSGLSSKGDKINEVWSRQIGN